MIDGPVKENRITHIEQIPPVTIHSIDIDGDTGTHISWVDISLNDVENRNVASCLARCG